MRKNSLEIAIGRRGSVWRFYANSSCNHREFIYAIASKNKITLFVSDTVGHGYEIDNSQPLYRSYVSPYKAIHINKAELIITRYMIMFARKPQ